MNGNVTYSCDQCEYEANVEGNLKKQHQFYPWQNYLVYQVHFLNKII